MTLYEPWMSKQDRRKDKIAFTLALGCALACVALVGVMIILGIIGVMEATGQI